MDDHVLGLFVLVCTLAILYRLHVLHVDIKKLISYLVRKDD